MFTDVLFWGCCILVITHQLINDLLDAFWDHQNDLVWDDHPPTHLVLSSPVASTDHR